jgi:hypothetical protein
VRLEEETVWLTQAQLVELFQSSKANISEHIKHIFEEGELNENSVVRKFRTTASDGKNYEIAHYNLDMIISLGYRINSKEATKFRQWATERLKEYIVKGFTLDDKQAPHLVLASSSPCSRKLLTSPAQAPHLAGASSSPRGNKLLTLRKQAPHLAGTFGKHIRSISFSPYFPNR